MPSKPRRKHNHEHHLGELGRLDTHRRHAQRLQADPSFGPIALHAHPRHITEDQRDDRHHQQRPAPRDQALVVHPGKAEANCQRHDQRDSLPDDHSIVVHLPLGRVKAGAGEHDHTHHQQGDHGQSEKQDTAFGKHGYCGLLSYRWLSSGELDQVCDTTPATISPTTTSICTSHTSRSDKQAKVINDRTGVHRPASAGNDQRLAQAQCIGIADAVGLHQCLLTHLVTAGNTIDSIAL